MNFTLLNWMTRWLGIRKRPYSEIEPGIKPLVDILNHINGVSTIASCEGHFFGGAPYVYFKAPAQTAAALVRLLRDAQIRNQPALQTGWVIHGLFSEKYELTYYLYSPTLDRCPGGLLQAIWLFIFKRRRLTLDLLTLAAYLREKSVFLDVREINEPEISTSCNEYQEAKKSHITPFA
jgi:hypothetical protein